LPQGGSGAAFWHHVGQPTCLAGNVLRSVWPKQWLLNDHSLAGQRFRERGVLPRLPSWRRC